MWTLRRTDLIGVCYIMSDSFVILECLNIADIFDKFKKIKKLKYQ